MGSSGGLASPPKAPISFPFSASDRVVEYDKDFKEIWRYDIAKPWAALRLKNGNTLITNERDSLTREVNSKGETVWEFNCLTDLPAEYQFTSAPQSCTRLANGNTIFTSRGKERRRPPTHRSHSGQESRLGAAGLEDPRRRHRRADPGRSRHPGNPGRIRALNP